MGSRNASTPVSMKSPPLRWVPRLAPSRLDAQTGTAQPGRDGDLPQFIERLIVEGEDGPSIIAVTTTPTAVVSTPSGR